MRGRHSRPGCRGDPSMRLPATRSGCSACTRTSLFLNRLDRGPFIGTPVLDRATNAMSSKPDPHRWGAAPLALTWACGVTIRTGDLRTGHRCRPRRLSSVARKWAPASAAARLLTDSHCTSIVYVQSRGAGRTRGSPPDTTIGESNAARRSDEPGRGRDRDADSRTLRGDA